MKTSPSCVLSLLLALAAAPSCASSPDAADVVTGHAAAAVTEELNLRVDDVTVMDVFAGRGETPLPVAVLLHGTLGERGAMHPLARSLAETGAVVFVPSWPVLDRPSYADRDADGYRRQVEAVVCALRRSKTLAPRYGGDPDQVTLVGYSGGGMVGATVALVDDPPWEGIGCDPDVDHAPIRFVGLAGDYRNTYQYGGVMGPLFDPFDPLLVEPSSAAEVRLVHGLYDTNVDASDSGALVDRLVSADVDARLLVLTADHGDLIDPAEPNGSVVVGVLDELVHGRSSAFDARPSTRIGLRFDGDRCTYDGPAGLQVGDIVSVRAHDVTDGPAAFAFANVRPETTAAEVASVRSATLLAPPRWVVGGSFRRVAAGTSTDWTWMITDAAYAWQPVCYDDAPGSGTFQVVIAGTTDDGAFVVLPVR